LPLLVDLCKGSRRRRRKAVVQLPTQGGLALRLGIEFEGAAPFERRLGMPVAAPVGVAEVVDDLGIRR
jgi:hypothetical protein